MFVMKTGICQRPPLQWPQEVLAAAVCFPYILTLQPHGLSVYSMVDQRHKQTVSLSGAKGLLSTPGTPAASLHHLTPDRLRAGRLSCCGFVCEHVAVSVSLH